MKFQYMPMGKKFGLIILMIILLIFGFSCSKKKNSKSNKNTITDVKQSLMEIEDTISIAIDLYPLATMSNIKKLLLLENIPLKITYDELKQRLPMISDLITEGAGSLDKKYGLFEANLAIEIFGVNGRMEFNFRIDTLYGFYFQVRGITSTEADELCVKLLKYYTNRFGNYEIIEEDWEGYLSIHYNWVSIIPKFGIVKNIYNSKNSIVGWGFH